MRPPEAGSSWWTACSALLKSEKKRSAKRSAIRSNRHTEKIIETCDRLQPRTARGGSGLRNQSSKAILCGDPRENSSIFLPRSFKNDKSLPHSRIVVYTSICNIKYHLKQYDGEQLLVILPVYMLTPFPLLTILPRINAPLVSSVLTSPLRRNSSISEKVHQETVGIT